MRAGVLTVMFLAFAAAADAHRLDEYLQATRISVEPDRIVAEINLTPGAAVADEIFAAIDSDHDGKVSESEGLVYAEHVVNSLSLDVDGQREALRLDSYSAASLTDMRLGEGVIRLRATARTRPATGLHRLSFANTHRSDIGVYLINALVPADERIRITRQSRDMLQHEFTMDYTISEAPRGSELATALPPVLGLSLAAGAWLLVRLGTKRRA